MRFWSEAERCVALSGFTVTIKHRFIMTARRFCGCVFFFKWTTLLYPRVRNFKLYVKKQQKL